MHTYQLFLRRAEQEAGPLGVRGRALRENNPKLLDKLLSLCFAKFHSVVQAHAVLLFHLHRAKKVYNGELAQACTYIVASSPGCSSEEKWNGLGTRLELMIAHSCIH